MPTKTATTAPSVKAPAMPDPLETAAAHIRRRAAYSFKMCDDGVTPNPLLEAFLLLKFLRSGHVETAIHCHGVLVKQACSLLREYGITDYWSDLIDKVHDFLESHGWKYNGHRWITQAEWEAEMWARRERPALVG